jgi:hypothetical protein
MRPISVGTASPQVSAVDKGTRTAVGEHGRAAEVRRDPLG